MLTESTQGTRRKTKKMKMERAGMAADIFA
jgi:hypothetical protein